MSPQRIDAGGAGLEIALAESVERAERLLLDGFHRDAVDRFVAGGLEERLGIGAIGLVPVAVASDVGGRQERDAVPERLELPAPVMGRAAGLQEDLGGRAVGEEAAEPRA